MSASTVSTTRRPSGAWFGNVLKSSLYPPSSLFLARQVLRFCRSPGFTLGRFLAANKLLMGSNHLRLHRGRLVSGLVSPPIPSKAMDSYFRAFSDSPSAWEGLSQARRSAPVVFSMALTTECGYKCVYCSAARPMSGTRLKTDDWIRLIAEAQDMGVAIIQLTGGEPLLQADICRIVASADKRSVVNIFTTGQGLTAELARALAKAGLFGMSISLDSADRTVHDERRGKIGAWDTAVQAMEIAARSGVFLASTMVCPSELPTLDEFVAHCRLLRSKGVRELMVTREVASGRAVDKAPARGELLELAARARRAVRGLIITLPDEMKGPQGMGCLAGSVYAYISAQGDIFPCDFLPMNFGNVRNRTLRDAWIEMRDAVKIPRPYCMADQFHMGVAAVDWHEMQAKLDATTPGKYPGFYEALQGINNDKGST